MTLLFAVGLVAAFLLVLTVLTAILAVLERCVPGFRSWLDEVVGQPRGWDL